MRSLVVALVLSACLVPLQAQDLRKTAAAKAACGPENETFNVDAMPKTAPAVPASDGQKALVYVIEQESTTPAFCIGRCGGLTLKVGLDGRWAGAVNGSSYTVVAVEPGEHHVCAAWQSHIKKLSEKIALRSFTAEPGKVYYLMTHDLLTGADSTSQANITLEVADADEARMLIESYPLVKATPRK